MTVVYTQRGTALALLHSRAFAENSFYCRQNFSHASHFSIFKIFMFELFLSKVENGPAFPPKRKRTVIQSNEKKLVLKARTNFRSKSVQNSMIFIKISRISK